MDKKNKKQDLGFYIDILTVLSLSYQAHIDLKDCMNNVYCEASKFQPDSSEFENLYYCF